MNKAALRKGGGFTLIEILIVLAILAILVAVVIPNLGGFLNRGKQQAYESDRRGIQVAVDAYYTDEVVQGSGPRKYPTTSGSGADDPTGGTNSYIDFDLLINNNFLENTPDSATTDNEPGATGNYSWYVDSKGRVRSLPTFTTDVYP